MTSTDLLVILGGFAAIAWVNWYFFLAERRVHTVSGSGGGVQEVTIVVRGGYDPAQIRVR